MKVKELIEELKKQNQDADVWIKGSNEDADFEDADNVDGNPASCWVPVEITSN